MLPKSVQKLVARQEVLMAMTLGWIVAPVVGTLMGFYLGTFVASQHIQDLLGGDIDKGVFGGIIGFVVAIIGTLIATSIYPKVIEKEYIARESHGAHH